MFTMQVYEENISQKHRMYTLNDSIVFSFKALQPSESVSLPMADEWNHSDKT